jgi:hypothetical protein
MGHRPTTSGSSDQATLETTPGTAVVFESMQALAKNGVLALTSITGGSTRSRCRLTASTWEFVPDNAVWTAIASASIACKIRTEPSRSTARWLHRDLPQACGLHRDYLAGELSSAATAAFDHRLSRCMNCGGTSQATRRQSGSEKRHSRITARRCRRTCPNPRPGDSRRPRASLN